MSIRPNTLLIYYAWPSVINGASSIQGAAADFQQYDYVVLGEGLEKMSHADHQNTIDILARPELQNTTIFGYIDAGVPEGALNNPLSEIETRVGEWKQMGVHGIFFDLFGYDYGVSRGRQIAAMTFAHHEDLLVTVNAWNPDDVFGSTPHALNPEGVPPIRGGVDFYLSESYQIAEGDYQEGPTWKAKAEALEVYRAELKFKIFSITTNNVVNQYDQDKFYYAWYSALLYGHEATGWGEYLFSADQSNHGIAPFRPRPTVSPGCEFISPVLVNNTRHLRRTSQSSTPSSSLSGDLGEVWIDTETHQYGSLAR